MGLKRTPRYTQGAENHHGLTVTGLNHWRMDIRRRFPGVANNLPAYFRRRL
jgi:hypothetical protein